MPNFSAASLEKLDYDFTSFDRNDGGGKCRGRGIVPEPSDAAIKRFGEAMKDIFKDLGDVQLNDEGGVILTDELLDMAETDEQTALLRLAVSELCGGSPSAEDLEQLPPRVYNAFSKWISAELFDPKVLKTGMRR